MQEKSPLKVITIALHFGIRCRKCACLSAWAFSNKLQWDYCHYKSQGSTVKTAWAMRGKKLKKKKKIIILDLLSFSQDYKWQLERNNSTKPTGKQTNWDDILKHSTGLFKDAFNLVKEKKVNWHIHQDLNSERYGCLIFYGFCTVAPNQIRLMSESMWLTAWHFVPF